MMAQCRLTAGFCEKCRPTNMPTMCSIRQADEKYRPADLPTSTCRSALADEKCRLVGLPTNSKFVQCWTNVEDVRPMLYKCFTNASCLLGWGSNPRSPTFQAGSFNHRTRASALPSVEGDWKMPTGLISLADEKNRPADLPTRSKRR